MLASEENNINEIKNTNFESDSLAIESQMINYMMTEEGQKIKSDIELLIEMGYDRTFINKVYILLQPENIERAIEYMTENNGVYQHNFFENYSNKDKDICFICKNDKKCHFDYIPEENIADNNNNNDNNINNNDIHNSNNIYINTNNNNNSILNNINNFGDFNLELDNISFNFRTNDEILKKRVKKNPQNECQICYDEIDDKEKESNMLPCGHFCCRHCWINYFKTLISEANVEDIKCVNFTCNNIIPEEFILKYIKEEEGLMEKYNRFKLRAEIFKDENKKLCPYPDCESFLEKSEKTKYVKCKMGHEFCFECLKPPHGKTTCESMDTKFLNWKKNKRVKKCPKCKIFIEKNEGCNHMTCQNCKYQWCWLCEKTYNYEHYSSGQCTGHQFTRADNIKDLTLCCFTIQSLFPCFYAKITGIINIESKKIRYFAIFGLWLLGFFAFAGFSMHNFTSHKINRLYGCRKRIFYFSGILIAFLLFISFQLLFTLIITPFIVIALFNPNFLDMILFFLNIND